MKPVIIIAIAVVLIVGVSVTSISAQSQYDIPSWVKGIAGFWAEDKITDSEFGEGLSFLIDSNIIKVPLIQELQNEITQLESQVTQLEAENNELKSKDYSNTSILKTVSKFTKTYTNNLFGFSLVHPSVWDVEENVSTMNKDQAGIVSISLYTNIPQCDYAPGLIVHYVKEEPINSYDTEKGLLDYFEPLIYFEESSQTKLVDREIVKLQDGYKLTYTFNDIALFPEIEYDDGTICVEEFFTVKNQYVIFQYNNGDRYDLIFASEDLHYDDSILEFERTVSTFKRVN